MPEIPLYDPGFRGSFLFPVHLIDCYSAQQHTTHRRDSIHSFSFTMPFRARREADRASLKLPHPPCYPRAFFCSVTVDDSRHFLAVSDALTHIRLNYLRTTTTRFSPHHKTSVSLKLTHSSSVIKSAEYLLIPREKDRWNATLAPTSTFRLWFASSIRSTSSRSGNSIKVNSPTHRLGSFGNFFGKTQALKWLSLESMLVRMFQQRDGLLKHEATSKTDATLLTVRPVYARLRKLALQLIPRAWPPTPNGDGHTGMQATRPNPARLRSIRTPRNAS